MDGEGLEPGTLLEDPWKYFNRVPGAFLVPLKDLETIRARPKGIANAEKYMQIAYEGKGKRRDPISVSKLEHGKWRVEDGNSTTNIARKHGWKYIPAVEVEASGEIHTAGLFFDFPPGPDDMDPALSNLSDAVSKLDKAEKALKSLLQDMTKFPAVSSERAKRYSIEQVRGLQEQVSQYRQEVGNLFKKIPDLNASLMAAYHDPMERNDLHRALTARRK